MVISVQAPFNVPNEDELNEKLESLSKFHPKITKCNVYFKVKDGRDQGEVTSEIEVFLPGAPIFSAAQSQQYMDAFKAAYEKTERQLKKLKGKITEHR